MQSLLCIAGQEDASSMSWVACMQVMPFILRRTKDAVLSELPPKIIQDVFVEPSPLQSRLYEDFSRSPASAQVASSLGNSAPAGGVEAAAGKAPHVFQVCALDTPSSHDSVHLTTSLGPTWAPSACQGLPPDLRKWHLRMRAGSCC